MEDVGCEAPGWMGEPYGAWFLDGVADRANDDHLRPEKVGVLVVDVNVFWVREQESFEW